MSYVFLSYCREDSGEARRLREELSRRNVEVWWDDHLRSGDQWRTKLRDVIQRADAMIVCLSRALEKREESVVFSEIAVAGEKIERRGAGNPFLWPVALDPCGIPSFRLHHDVKLSDIHVTKLHPASERRERVDGLARDLLEAFPGLRSGASSRDELDQASGVAGVTLLVVAALLALASRSIGDHSTRSALDFLAGVTVSIGILQVGDMVLSTPALRGQGATSGAAPRAGLRVIARVLCLATPLLLWFHADLGRVSATSVPLALTEGCQLGRLAISANMNGAPSDRFRQEAHDKVIEGLLTWIVAGGLGNRDDRTALRRAVHDFVAPLGWSDTRVDRLLRQLVERAR